MSVSPLTPVDYIAAGYWQDFLADRSIAGGTAYESELRACTLDESLVSLQRVDILLSRIRRDLIKADKWDEAELLADGHYRNLMVFLAFYAGRVLAQQWQHTPRWYGQFELSKRYPNLSLISDDFYQHMAVVYDDDSVEFGVGSTSLFFALEPIGLRLFGHIDRQLEAVQGGEIASGLYQAVCARLPDTAGATAATDASQSTKQFTATNVNLDSGGNGNIINSDKHAQDKKKHASVRPAVVVDEYSEAMMVNDESVSKKFSERDRLTNPQESDAISSLENGNSSSLSSVKSATMSSDTSPTPQVFRQLLIELDEIEVVQTAGNIEYQKASKVLDQFEKHIAKKDKPRAQITFSERHLAAKEQALQALQESSRLGNTAAMLRLAMYELLGEGISLDDSRGAESGLEWVKQAANSNDCRGQRLLSKMYYQGIGVPQDVASGKHWLDKAAKNGHPEAANVVMQWQQAQALIATQKQEQHSSKRYMVLFAVVIVMAILILVIV